MTGDKELHHEGHDRSAGIGEKLDAIRASMQHEFPSGDIGDMLAQIEIGYLEPFRKFD